MTLSSALDAAGRRRSTTAQQGHALEGARQLSYNRLGDDDLMTASIQPPS
jgi:hypothetical protein